MKSNSKPIGSYIRQVDVRNKDLKVETLLGLTVDKRFIPSVANTVGSNMANYKIISKGQFACSLMQVRRDKKMPVALLADLDDAIISQAYPVFEIIEPEELLPEYLMMWMSRSEFDREACFYAVGGVRGSLEWENFCNMELPVPDIGKQREIVKEYRTIVDRIALNEKLNQKLEETAQAIYKQWFVDFEFPISADQAADLGNPELEGQPYKSSGSEMVWNDELKQDIPAGWKASRLADLCSICSSRRIFYSEYVSEGVPFYRGKEIGLKKEGQPISDPLYISEDRYNEIAQKNEIPQCGDILLTAVGTLGVSYFVQDEKFYFKDGNVIWFRCFSEENANHYIYDYMQSDSFRNMIEEITIGSTQSAITIATIGEQFVIYPPFNNLRDTYFRMSSTINTMMATYKTANARLNDLKNILLAKMTKAGA